MVIKMANEKRLDLIDRSVLRGKLIRELNKTGKYTPYECGLDDALSYLDEQPTVDVVEVVHGWWMPQYDRCWIDGQRWKTGYHCSSCMGFNKVESHYCPNCGARMDGDGNA